ncbi:YciI family protein [Rhodococcus opacus]|uniref:YciI family protein n=1 Tax=Rhodococcus opacus TaxID=37919 RepID=UPI001F544C15|nr:YciI family protein [Rhodococcus opacus]
MNAFADECRRRGVFVSGHPLQPEHTATTVSVRDGRTLITDGPFAETHEHLGGAYVLDCRNQDEPWSWPPCARWPSRGRSRCGPSSMCQAWITVPRM